jgi:hypothetical protein
VAEHDRVVHIGDHDLQLLGQVGHLTDDAGEGTLHVARQRLELGALANAVARVVDLGDEVGIGLHPLGDAHPRAALDEDAERPVGQAYHPGDRAQHAHVVELVGTGRLHLGVAAADQDDRPVAAQGVVDQLEAARLAHVERDHQVREGDRVAQGQDTDARGQAAEPVLGGLLGRLGGAVDVEDGHCGSPLSIGTWRRLSCWPTSGSSMRSIPSS